MPTNVGAKNRYNKISVTVHEIRDASVFVMGKAGHTIPIGRSLFSHISDERFNKYNGPLPQEFAVELIEWRVNKGDI